MTASGRSTHAELDLAALQQNFQQCRQLAPASQVLAVIKANAYGHGMERAAQVLSDADGFAVATLDEAVRLRRVTQSRIVLLEGVLNAEEMALADRLGLDQVVHSMGQLELLVRAPAPRSPFRIWLKFDTGMHRLGFDAKDAFDVWHTLKHLDQVDDEIVLMSHLANADDPDDSRTPQQLTRFDKLQQRLDASNCSLANSAGVCGWPDSHHQWVRPGLMLFGATPLRGSAAEQLGLQPVLTLKSSLIAINSIKAGSHIGYGGRYCCPSDTTIGVVAIGYGDGYPRNARDGTPVLVNGKAHPLVGRVSMDMLTIDLGPTTKAKIGDPVILWGKGLPIERVAEMAGSISYELLCGLTSRVKTVVNEASI